MPRIASSRDARGVTMGWGWVAFIGALSGCVYDGAHRCDAGAVVEDRACVCGPGLGWDTSSSTCIPCGENEETVAGVCTCAPGYHRDVTSGACTSSTPGQGDPCNDSGACTHAENPFCKTGSAAGGYCTSEGCADSTGCTGGYACDTSTSPSYCQRPPVGLGAPCTSDADCAGSEATWCDTYQTKKCVVRDCTLAPNDCFEGYVCCDLSSLAVADIPATLCEPGACVPVPQP